jgi:hypothetical protein
VVLANVEALADADLKRLSTFVERGGGLLVFTGDRVRPEGAARLAAAGLGVGQVLERVTATELPWRLERWEASHPIFKPFADPEHGDLRRPAFTAITPIKPANEARVLAWFRGGAPALLERSKGRGKVIWFTSACDRAWGDWPRGRMYVPMIHQIVAYACGLADGGRIRQEITSIDRKPGIIESDGLVHVVNPDPSESETGRCTPSEFADRFGFKLPVPAGPDEASQSAPASVDDRLRSDEIWPSLALILLGLLLSESFLANRTAA